MLASSWDLTSVVYKAGHHGSDTSSSASFLTAVAPDISVISSGIENQYGHPHPAVLGRLSDAGAAVLRTDELGTIEVITDGQGIWWESTGE
jgi:competence protein ComEC